MEAELMMLMASQHPRLGTPLKPFCSTKKHGVPDPVERSHAKHEFSSCVGRMMSRCHDLKVSCLQ